MFQKILQSIILKNRIKKKYNFFSFDYRSVNTNEIVDIRKYLTKEMFFK